MHELKEYKNQGYHTWLRELGLCSLKKTLGRPYRSCSVSIRGYKRAGKGLNRRAYSDKTTGNGFKLKDCRFKLDIREKILRCE